MPDHTSNPPWRNITLLLLAAICAFGIAVAAILPPFEGPDETAHFSRMQSQAFPLKTDESDPKKQNALRARISTDVVNYDRHGPMPYQWIDVDELHKNDSGHHYRTYRDFFSLPPLWIDDYAKTYGQTALPAGYAPSQQFNWQYQHPALYYIVTGQILKRMAGHASLITIFLTLRIFSWLLAFAGFAIGLGATLHHLAKTGVADAAAITALGALYPFLMPEFFWEFARLGNDSLCLFFFGIIWALLLWHIRAPRGDVSIYLGVVLAFGCLTKAIMIPVAGGIIAFLIFYHFLVVRKDAGQNGSWWVTPFKTAGIVLLITAPLYFAMFHGGSMGSAKFKLLLMANDPLAQLSQHFLWPTFFDCLFVLTETAVWMFGSWSVIVIDLPVHAVIDIFNGVILLIYIIASRRRSGITFYLPMWVGIPLFLGLIGNILIVLILDIDDSTPGYYLHILAPAIALIYGTALAWIGQKSWTKILAACLCLPVIAFNFLIAASYMMVFSGCALPVRVAGSYRLPLAAISQCAGQSDLVLANLSVLAWPAIALAALWMAAVLLFAAGMLALSVSRRRPEQFDLLPVGR